MKNIQSRSLINSSWNLFLIQTFNYIFPVGVLFLLLNRLDIKAFGELSLCFSIAQIIIVFNDFGLGTYGVKLINSSKNNKIESSKILSAILIIKVILFFAAFSLFTLFDIFILRKATTLNYAFFIYIFAQSLSTEFLFIACRKSNILVRISFIFKFLYLILVLVFVQSNQNSVLVPLSLGVTTLITSLLSLAFSKRIGFTLLRPESILIFSILRSSWLYFISRFSAVINSSSSLIVLSTLLKPAELGAYALFDQVYRVIQTLISPVVQALYPHLNQLKNFILFKKIVKIIFIITPTASVLIVVIAPYLLRVFSMQEYYPILNILPYLIILVPAHYISTLFGFPLAAICDLETEANLSVMIGLLGFVSSFLCVYIFLNVNQTNLLNVIVFTELFILLYRYKFIYLKTKKLLNENFVKG